MNNESIKSPKLITTISNTSTSANNNYSTSSKSSSGITATSYSPISSPLSLLSQSTQSYSTSVQFDVAVSAIAAVVNASNNLPVTTPPNAAAVVAVAVSSLAAAIIPDTPIVSIAGSTLSEITTTTTSTKTTPTPIPTTKETDNSKNNNNNNTSNSNCNKNSNNKDLQNTTSPWPSTSSVHPSSSSYSPLIASVKDLDPMSVANSFVTGDLTNASNAVANAAAAENKNNCNSIKQIKDNSKANTAKGSVSTLCGTVLAKTDSPSTAIESKSISTTTLTSSASQPINTNATVSTSKTDDINVTPNKTKSKDFLSESWEESRIKDWDDSKLKELLDEAYSYKNPRDKENKSKTFLQLLEKAENEDQSYPFCVTSLGSRNLSNSITSSNYYHYQPNTHYQSHSHNHNRSHHHHQHYKQGGSLQDLLEIGLHESHFDCDQTFGIGISGSQRTRRQNHNSRQKKFSSSVSSRQREGGSLPSNVNVTHQLSVGVGSAVVNDLSLMQQDIAAANVTTNTNKASNKKEQRRNASKAAAANSTAVVCSDAKEYNSINSADEINANTKSSTTITAAAAATATATTNSSYTASGGDFIIDMGEPMMDIQQQQKILQCKGQDAATQGQPFYERLANNDTRIPRANLIGATKGTYFAPTTSHCYVDETVRFNALERSGGTNNGLTSSAIDAKFLPLDENYKSCKSVLGSDSDKSQETLLGKSKPNTIYTKISSPASGSASLTGTTNNIATLTQRQLDENGNALSEIYQNSSGAGSGSGSGTTIQINAVSPTAHNASAALLNYCSNVSTSATVTISPHTASTTVSTSATVTTTFTSGPSQAKAKAKKKSQQERNTTTVCVESVAGYRGTDPVEELVKYIESSGEDKQAGSGSGSKSGDKKKERKKDKDKHQKLKKSNSLEELRSGAKMEMHELKRTAATTESNAVLVRQKNGGGGKQNKNNSYSTADINKNLEGINPTQAANSRKTDRRSWGNEDLKYLEDQQNANLTNEDKMSTNTTTITTTSTTTNTNSAKERKNKIGGGSGSGSGSGSASSSAIITISSKDEKETKDKTSERNERNFSNNIIATTIPNEKSDKLEKTEKTEKMEKYDKNEKSENKLEKSEKRKKQEIPPNAVTVVDILAIESVLPETAEFHVVTKKKKPKKQKVINNLEETTVTFNRTHNFTMQKTSTFNQQQQQMTVRYKYYHHDNSSSNTGISNTNTNSQNQYHHQQANYQQYQQLVNHNQQSQSQQQQSQQQQQQQHNSTERFTNAINDKSRRKSTSSVPPSEKSDSSDLDSVHSLPIESSTSSTKTNATNTTLNVAKVNTQQRIKNAKNFNNNNNTILVNSNSMATTSQSNKNHNLPPAPISYADIARTNKEIADAAAASASGILINNNEITTECRNADALTTDLLNTEIKTAAATTTTTKTTVAITPTTAINKPYKNKKTQIKQDFPELSVTVASTAVNDDRGLSAKTITYSQSLISITNSSQNTSAANQSQSSGGGDNGVGVGGGGGGGGVSNSGSGVALSVGGLSTSSDIAPSCLPSSSPDSYTKVSMTDQPKNLIVHQHVNIPPLQHSQQQILNKFRTVENDSITTSKNTSTFSSSAATYMASIKSNNLDQQYPALEKTIKRHSSANVSIMGTTVSNTNASNQAPINFAAAAKQQISTNVAAEQQYILINSNKNSALTTSNINNKNTIHVAFVPSSNMTANKKSKEKSPPLLSATNLIPTTNQTAVDASSLNASATGTTAVIGNTKRSKKERQQQQQLQHLQLQQNPVDSTQPKPNQSNSISNRKLIKTQLKSSNSLPLGLTSLTGFANSTTTSNRPAVIILNDDRNSGSCTADNQFTFGDFNEEELKLFDDDHNIPVTEYRAENIDYNASQSEEEDKQQEQQQQQQQMLEQQMPDSSEAALKSPSAIYFNDSGTSCNNDMANNSTSDMLSSSSIEASSPNTSFVANSQGKNGATALNMPALNNNQSSDSGIYTDKTKSSNSSCSTSNSNVTGGVGVVGCSNDVATKHKQKQNQIQNQQITPTKEENHKLNNFLSSSGSASVHTSMDNLNPPPPPPPPQQLETCNDIETAIIAAARAAAKQHHPPLLNNNHHHQQQQQQYKNSNTSSNSSSFSSSSLSSMSSACQQHQQQNHQNHQHHQKHHQQQQQQQQLHQHHSTNISSSSNKIYQNQHGRNNNMSYNQQSPSQYDEDYDNDDDNDVDNDNDNDNIDSFANTPRSRSPSRPRRISIAGGKVANKEFDIHFIPPTTMPTAFSTQQHNDIIIDFIGSAWEEVANSKVTKVYDGQ